MVDDPRFEGGWHGNFRPASDLENFEIWLTGDAVHIYQKDGAWFAALDQGDGHILDGNTFYSRGQFLGPFPDKKTAIIAACEGKSVTPPREIR